MNDNNTAELSLGDFSELELPEINREQAQRLGKVAVSGSACCATAEPNSPASP